MRPVWNRTPSVERHAHPFFLAPDDVTRRLQLLALNDRRETIQNEKRGYDFQRGHGLRKVANRAINRTAAERLSRCDGAEQLDAHSSGHQRRHLGYEDVETIRKSKCGR